MMRDGAGDGRNGAAIALFFRVDTVAWVREFLPQMGRIFPAGNCTFYVSLALRKGDKHRMRPESAVTILTTWHKPVMREKLFWKGRYHS